MLEAILSSLFALIISILLYTLRKVHYINHVVTEIKVHVEYLKNDVNEIKQYIFKR